MRKFIKIVESITNDYATNQEIERILAAMPAGNQNLILDGLELIHNQPTGIEHSAWVQHMRTINPDMSESDIHDTMETLVHHFPNMVSRNGTTLTWTSALHRDEELDMGDPTMSMAQQQIEYTSQIIDLMVAHDRFTARDIMTTFAATSGLDPASVHMLVSHSIESNPGLIKSVGGGYYEIVKAERPKTAAENMAYWRDLASGTHD